MIQKLINLDYGIGNQQTATEFMDALISGDLANFTLSSYTNTYFRNLSNKGLYDIIKENGTFVETLGIFYEEDYVSSFNSDGGTSTEEVTTSTRDANKTERRVITYTVSN